MRFGLFPGRSPLLGESFDYFLFLRVLRCFSSPGSPHQKNMVIAGLQPAGLSHSEIPGSRVICTYPGLIAACHVLHRLREPRHPPDALTCFRLYAPTGQDKKSRNRKKQRSYFQLSVEILISLFSVFQLEVFTYSLVCQYVKDLSPVSNYR